MTANRPHRLSTVAALAALLASAGLPTAVGSVERMAAQQPSSGGAQVAIHEIGNNEIRVYDFGGLRSSDGEIASWLSGLERLIVMSWAKIGQDQWAVRAAADGHERLERLLAQAIDSAERDEAEEEDEDPGEDEPGTFGLRLFAVEVSGDRVPAVGRPMPADVDRYLAAPSIMVRAGEQASIQSVRDQVYIGGYQPVVSTSAVGYQPEIKRIELGVLFEFGIDVNDEDETMIFLEGYISDGDIEEQVLQFGDARLPIGLPIVDKREVQVESVLPATNRPIVLATMNGFEEGMQLVIAASLEELDLND